MVVTGVCQWRSNARELQTKDRAEAKRVLAEREAQAVKGQRVPIAKTTWTEAAEALLAHYEPMGHVTPRSELSTPKSWAILPGLQAGRYRR